MRVAERSDTHLPRGARGNGAACIERKGGGGGSLPAGDFMDLSVLEDLRALGPPVHAVAGNVDAPELHVELPATRMVHAERVRIAMLHDSGPAAGRFERLRRRFPDAQAVVFGHSHLPLLEAREGFAIFNPGSPTERRRAPHHTMGLATVEGDRIEFDLIALD